MALPFFCTFQPKSAPRICTKDEDNIDGSAIIYAPGTTSANALGFATVNAVMGEANTELGLHGTAYSGDAWRPYQEALKNALDNANNNKTFVQPTPCAFSFAE